MDILPLLEPIRIGGLRLANRVVMSPMTREFSPGGRPGLEVAAYYRRRAEAGVGLIVTEGVGVAHQAAVDSGAIPVMHGEAALAGWRRVVEEVHAAGAPIIPQLWHQGPMRDHALSQRPEVAGLRPSGLWGAPGGMVSLDPEYVERMLPETRPMTESEIQDAVDAYAVSARNAMSVGFDGVALHGAHGYLIDSFLWPVTNRRTDRWGGDPARRTAFPVAVVKAIRAAIGPDKPVFLRFSQFKMQDYKALLAETPAELEQLLVPIAEAGVDVFDGSQRYFDTPIFPDSELNLAGWAKKLTGRKSMAVGGVGLDQGRRKHHIDTGASAASNLGRLVQRLARGEFDLVAVGRSMLNDPDWFRRVRQNRPFEPFDPANLKRLT